MKITRLQFKNFMGYNNLKLPKEDEDLPDGLILISGKNSYGKSTILEGILFAFFGPGIFVGRNAESFITYGRDKSEISIYFILDNIKYYIIRKWGRTGSTSSKLFEMDKNSKAYREIVKFNISDFFEISKEQALNTVFVRQGEVEELANKKGAQLRDMLIDLFRLNIIDDSLKYLEKVFKSKKIDKEKLEKSRVPIERIEEDINRKRKEIENDNDLITQNKARKKQLEKDLMKYPPKSLIAELEEKFKLSRIAEEKYKSYKENFENKINKSGFNINDFSSLEKIKHNLTLKTKAKSQLEGILKELDAKRQAITAGKGITKGKMKDLSENMEKMKESISFINKGNKKQVAECPTCHSPLTKEHYDEIMNNYDKEISLGKKKLVDISKLIQNTEEEIKGHKEDLDNIKSHITTIQGLEEDYKNYHSNEKEVMQNRHEIENFYRKNKELFKNIDPESIKTINVEIEKIINDINVLEKDSTKSMEKIEINKQRVNELQQEIKNMKKIEKTINEFEIDIEHVTKAKEFVRRFVTEYMVIKRLVKNIALKTDKYIKDFTSGQYSDLILDLYGTKKTGLSLKIKDHFNGQYESIEVLSGGDRTALGIALRLAISELMSIIRPTKDSPKKNPKIDFLLLDEPLAALDASRRERILKHLIQSKTFSQIFLITHTLIPQDIHTHKIIVEKDHSTGFSYARYEKSDLLY